MKRFLMLCLVAVAALAFSTSALACQQNCDEFDTGRCYYDENVLTWCEQLSGWCVLHPDICAAPPRPPVLAEKYEVASVTVERPNAPDAVTRTPDAAVALARPAPPIR